MPWPLRCRRSCARSPTDSGDGAGRRGQAAVRRGAAQGGALPHAARTVGARQAGRRGPRAAASQRRACPPTTSRARSRGAAGRGRSRRRWSRGSRAAVEDHSHPLDRLALELKRTPYFCSGCPHNTSTRVGAEQLIGVGIGCHTMVALENGDRRGHVLGMPQMGGEGAQWLGLAPFASEQHFTQNLGDGTFHHSGSLAIRAARRGRREHHLPAALQRRRRDDRRPAAAGQDGRPAVCRRARRRRA